VAGGDEPAGETEDERLARLVGELEGLSEDEARERLNKELEAVEPG
jgi:signal transduction histidine kinase